MTPITRVIVMDKWVNDYTQNWDNQLLLNYEKLIFGPSSEIRIVHFIRENLKHFKELFDKFYIKIVTKFEVIEKLILKIIYRLIFRDERIYGNKIAAQVLQNSNFIKSVIVVAMEIILFIENVEVICFYKLANCIILDLYELWKIINPFVRMDLTVPSDIRLHFQEIEIQLNTFMIFKKPSNNFRKEIDDYLKNNFLYYSDPKLKSIQDLEFNNQSLFVYHNPETFKLENLQTQVDISLDNANELVENLNLYQNLKPIYIFLRRILNYAIFLNKKISENLNLSNQTAKECETLLKKLLTSKDYFDIIYEKHIDQVIICSIIAILIHHKIYETKDYNSIVLAYQNSKPDDSLVNISTLFHKIIDKNIHNEPMTIIDFYQKVFAHRLKPLVTIICEESQDENIIVKRRKFSLPETEMRKKSQFEDETAFLENTIIYEPLQKTVFVSNTPKSMLPGIPHLLISKSSFMAYSAHSSPMISKSVNSSVVAKTPRSNLLKVSYTDYIESEFMKQHSASSSKNNNSLNGSSNKYRDLVKSNLGNIKVNAFPSLGERSDSFSMTPSFSGGSQPMSNNDVFFNENIEDKNNEQLSQKATPEFNKIQK